MRIGDIYYNDVYVFFVLLEINGDYLNVYTDYDMDIIEIHKNDFMKGIKKLERKDDSYRKFIKRLWREGK